MYQIDFARLLVLLALLGAGSFIATRLVRPAVGSQGHAAHAPQRIAIRGTLLMTLLGLASGVAGGLTEDSVGETAFVAVLHGIYSVCWAPAFLMAELQKMSAAPAATSRFATDLLGMLGLLLVPVLWFIVFLCAGHFLARRRRVR